MKKNKLTLSLIFLLTAFTIAVAQEEQPTHDLGRTGSFIQQLKSKEARSASSAVHLQLSSLRAIDVKIIDDQSEGNDIKIYGEVQGVKTSVFYIYGNPADIKGKIVIDNKEGYSLSTDPSTQNVIATKVDVNTLICVMPATPIEAAKKNEGSGEENKKYRTMAQPAYSSFPEAAFVLYLDFDGEYVNDSYWNSQMGGAKNCAGPNFTDAKIKSIWAGIAEKYRPWNINVTTDRSVFDAKSKALRHMVIYTNSWGSGGGIADIGSIANNGTDICWVFFANLVNDVNDMVVTGAHESGHAFGLQHDGSTGDGNYYKGQGNWGPIMGNNYQTANRDIWQWSKGEYNGATHHGGAPNTQDDVSIIAGNPSVGYRKDEDAGTTASAREIVAETDGKVLGTKNNGIITIRTDKDYFKFTTSGGAVTFNFQSSDKIWTLDEAVLDIQARLLDADGKELMLSNPTAGGSGYGVDASISKTLPSGTYYLEVDGVGYLDPKTTGYSDYASIGYYEISGNYPVVVTGINEPADALAYSIYPNPANDKLYVRVPVSTGNAFQIRITDAFGRLCFSGSQTSLQNEIDISNLAAGIYLLQAIDEKTQVPVTKKFIKE